MLVNPTCLITCLGLAAAPLPAKKDDGTAGVRIVRKHSAGQKYDLSFTSEDPGLKSKLDFKAQATVKAASAGAAIFEVLVNKIVSSRAGQAAGEKIGNVKLKVELDGSSVDASVTDEGDGGGRASLFLTSYEMMLGDVCQPPSAPMQVGKPLVEQGQTWQLVSVKAGVATLKATPLPTSGSPFTCEVTVSIEDGFAGTRKASSHVDLHSADPATGKPMVSEQHYTFDATRR
jgi:hypothetical protein